MKKSMLLAGLFQFAVALVLAAPAVAQQSSYTIHIPFRFNVSSQVLPAGEYLVRVVSPGAVQIHGEDHIANATFGAHRRNGSSRVPQNTELVFHRYGQNYFLSQVWFAAGDQGYELTVTSTEREYARQTLSADTVLRAAK
ncbi:MAG: hypothetical protein ACLGRW_03875 [Acidobacteriota bacterium]